MRRGEAGRGLRGMKALWEALERPCSGIPCLQIAGTNGKGSTAAWAASLLQAQSKRVGLFTSPHLVSFRERFRVDGVALEDALIAKHLPRVVALAREIAAPPLFFEIVTALGLLCFAEAGVDWVVLEVGLGGRLDPTTVIPVVGSIITSIGLDHCAWLGDDLASIAREKAGILREGVPAWIGALAPEAEAAIREEAKHRRAGLLSWYEQDFFLHPEPTDTLLCFTQGTRQIKGLRSPLHGAYQRNNLALALACVSALTDPKGEIAEGRGRRLLAGSFAKSCYRRARDLAGWCA